MRGLDGHYESVKNGPVVDAGLGWPSLQEEASDLLMSKFRSGEFRGDTVDSRWTVRFGEIISRCSIITTKVEITGRNWKLVEYGDAIPGSI